MKQYKKVAILADCDARGLSPFMDAVAEILGCEITPVSCICNGNRGGVKNKLRIVKYFMLPLSFLWKSKHYDLVIGWQQFFATNLAFFKKVLHMKKSGRIVVANFTYKRKNGFWGHIYYRYMRYAVNNEHVDLLHVPSYGYADRCCEELGLTKDKFVITHFGIPDTYADWQNSKAVDEDYVLSIGRSNRDFDFLVKAWQQECLRDVPLVIISDYWKPEIALPPNVKWLSNTTGRASRPWINGCRLMVIPIDDGNICSGDTVLLTGMMSKKPVIVTSPSTLAEMYVEHGKDGYCYEKNVADFARQVADLYLDAKRVETIGENARKSYLAKFSSYAMGKAIAEAIVEC